MLTMYLSLVATTEEQSLFEQIYYTYRKRMFFVANGILNDKILAEDAVQEAFLGIAKQISLFQDMPDHKVKAYVLTAAKNASLNLCREEQRFQQYQTDLEYPEPDTHQDQVLDEQIHKETDRLLRSVIATLPELQRDILLLRYSNDMNCSKIAAALGKKSSTVRKELSRARRTLRERCKKEGIEIED